MLSQTTTLLRPTAWQYLTNQRTSMLSAVLRSTTAPQIASFSTSPRSLLQKESPRKLASDETLAGNPTYPAFSMEGLGASRTVKIVVYTAITIIGTIETYAWCKWGWYKMYPLPDREERGDESATD